MLQYEGQIYQFINVTISSRVIQVIFDRQIIHSLVQGPSPLGPN